MCRGSRKKYIPGCRQDGKETKNMRGEAALTPGYPEGKENLYTLAERFYDCTLPRSLLSSVSGDIVTDCG